MKLTDYMHPDLIFVDVKAQDKPGVLKDFARRVAGHFTGVDPDQLYRKLKTREAESSTGIGQGVAVPHAIIEGLPNSVCLLITLSEAIDFNAIDQNPVRAVFLLISPPGETGLHIKLLARIARLAKREGFVEAVAASKNPEALYDRIKAEDNRHGERA